MHLERHLVEILKATVKFLSNNKNLGTDSFFIISDFQEFVKSMILYILNKQIFLSVMLSTEFAAYQCDAR